MGANIGDTVRDYTARFPIVDIHAFEPIPTTFATLRRNVGTLPRVHLHELALGAVDGTALMEAAPESGTNRLVASTAPRTDSPRAKVMIRRLDAFCVEQRIAQIDLLKTDCEGFDLDVLRGAEGLLATGAIDCIFSEVNFRRDGGHGDFFAIEAFLNPRGYDFHALYDYSDWHAPIGTQGFATALFARRPAAERHATPS